MGSFVKLERKALKELTRETESAIADLRELAERLRALAAAAPNRAGALQQRLHLEAERLDLAATGLGIELRAGFPAPSLVKRLAGFAGAVTLAIAGGPLGDVGKDATEGVAALAQQVLAHTASIDARVDLQESGWKIVEETAEGVLTATGRSFAGGRADLTVDGGASDPDAGAPVEGTIDATIEVPTIDSHAEAWSPEVRLAADEESDL